MVNELKTSSLVKCPECEKFRAIAEFNAFRGKDQARMTLHVCGHMVPKETALHVNIEEVLRDIP